MFKVAYQWYLRNRGDIAIFVAIMLAILLIFGYFRLYKLTPEKAPIIFEKQDG